MTRSLLVALALLVPAGGARAQDPDPEKFTPPGYAFCGFRDYERGGWVMQWEDRLHGFGTVLFARHMTCRSARRNFGRVRHVRDRPTRAGYRCVTLQRDYEYADVRCSRRGQPRVAFRYQTGS